jgi:RNA polymerase primary sigma factor
MSTSAAPRQHDSVGDSLTTYLREIGRYPLLKPADEANVARRVRQGDTQAISRLVCANLRFVVSVAKKYQHQGVPLADLINEGNLGLLRAAERFDETRGVKFISYAVWWVRQAIVQAIAEHGHAVRVPVGRVSVLRRVGRQADLLRQELGREPTQVEVMAESGMSEAEVALTMPIARSSISLDAPVGDDDARLIDYLPDETADSPDRDATDENLADSVDAALGQLKGREATVVRLYFGFEGGEPMTLEAIGDKLGVTRERVRQIKERALSRLRKSKIAPALATLRAD